MDLFQASQFRKDTYSNDFADKFLRAEGIQIQVSPKLFIPIQSSEYFELLCFRTNFTVAEVS